MKGKEERKGARGGKGRGGEGMGKEEREISSLGMKAQPNSETERAVSLHLYEIPPKPWLYRGLTIYRCFASK